MAHDTQPQPDTSFRPALANLWLVLGALEIPIALYNRDEPPKLPQLGLAHDCSQLGAYSVRTQCPSCKHTLRKTGVQQRGPAAGTPASQPKQTRCGNCDHEVDEPLKVHVCTKCDRPLPTDDDDALQGTTRITTLGSKRNRISQTDYDALQALVPPDGVMLARALCPLATIPAYLRFGTMEVTRPKKLDFDARFDALLQMLDEHREMGLLVTWSFRSIRYQGVLSAVRLSGKKTALLLEELAPPQTIRLEGHEPTRRLDMAEQLWSVARELQVAHPWGHLDNVYGAGLVALHSGEPLPTLEVQTFSTAAAETAMTLQEKGPRNTRDELKGARKPERGEPELFRVDSAGTETDTETDAETVPAG